MQNNLAFILILFVVNLVIIGMAGLFTYMSIEEQEPRAPKFGWAALCFHLILAVIIIFLPVLRIPIAWYLGTIFGLVIPLCIPFNPVTRPKAAADFLTGDSTEFEQYDERDTPFARNDLQPGQKEYREYYEELHPEYRSIDDNRRKRGGPVGKACRIDGYWWPNVAMLFSAHEFSQMVGDKAKVNLEEIFQGSKILKSSDGAPPRSDLEPLKATQIVKEWAMHLGAGEVGVCKIDPRWAYSKQGRIYYNNWEDWGKKITPLSYAVVFTIEMDSSMVRTAPHSPAVIESGFGYAHCAFITTILTRFFAGLGYGAHASHNRNGEVNLVPLAIDAGLGELGRFGYLISDKFGSRCRLAAVMTDMPLVPDAPVDLGVEKFCELCVKCGESCPSKSIPVEKEQTIVRGIKRWKLSADSCFEYWGKIGTDCSICMAVCPYGRPNNSLHKLVRFMLKKSYLARLILPHIDNIVYGRRWKSCKPKDWLQWSKEGAIEGTPHMDFEP